MDTLVEADKSPRAPCQNRCSAMHAEARAAVLREGRPSAPHCNAGRSGSTRRHAGEIPGWLRSMRLAGNLPVADPKHAVHLVARRGDRKRRSQPPRNAVLPFPNTSSAKPMRGAGAIARFV